jgi:phage FluMu protein Com
MSYSIQCVHCQAILKSPTPVPGGKTVKCPKCKQAFVTPEAEAAPPEPPPAPEPAPEPSAPAIPNMEIPEVDDELVAPDDDLVEPDEEEIVETDVEEEVGEEEDAKPKAKKKRKDEDDEEEPRSRKKKRRDEEDDEDEEPRSKKKRKIEDEEEDEEPRSRKKRKEDDEDDAPKKGKKKKKAGSAMTMILALVGGGVVLSLCLCCTCGGGGYFYTSKPMVGRWEPAEGPMVGLKVQMEFGYFGTGRVHTEGFDRRFNRQESITLHFTYSTSGRNPIVMEQTLTRVDAANNDNFIADMQRKEIGKTHRAHVTFDGDIMTIAHQDGFRHSSRWRRVR